MECPKCRTDNPDTLKFCGECGTPLEAYIGPTKTIETSVEELTTGSTFAGRYQIIEELGKGGMGRVYKVFDTKIKEKIALKLIKPEIASDQRNIERFTDELKIARKITHKNVGRMFDINEDKNLHYITMEYVEGQDLRGLIRQSGQLAVGTALSITRQVCQGLAEAHKLNVVHRDLKPSNIMIDKEGSARIMDFGIAKSVKPRQVTGEGVQIGTPAYMSPEQAQGMGVDRRTDIWSLGVVLYEMLTGQLPFKGDTEPSIFHSILQQEPEPVAALRTGIPAGVADIINRALAKSPNRRYQNSSDMLADIQSLEENLETKDTTKEIPKAKDIWKRRVPQIVGIYTIAILAVWQIIKGLVNRFALSPFLPDFSLVALLSLVPAVTVLAYFHKMRGRAKWGKAEKILIPLNLFVSAALLIFLFYGKDLGAATKTVTYTDEEGQTIERVIPKSEFRKKVALCYFDNKTGDPSLDWLQYGFVKALQIDLGQDLYLNIGAGFDPKLKQSGYLEGVGVPLTLKREIAQDRHLDYFVSGSFSGNNEEFTVYISLYETKRMKLLEERSFSGTDIFKLTDEISEQLKHDLEIPAYHIAETEDKPVSEMITDSLSAFESYVMGDYMQEIKSDYAKALDYLRHAVDEDPTFAYAWYYLTGPYMQSNQSENAEEAIRSAMQHDYKFSERDKFEVKYIYYYIFKQDQEMVFSLAKRRIELFPEDIEGHEWLAVIYENNNQLDEALSEYERILELDPKRYDYLQEIAQIYESQTEFEKALDVYKQYTEHFPDNLESFTAIGSLYRNLGDHEQAKAYYKKANLIEPENIQVLLSLANIESDLGNFKSALEQHSEALEVCKTPNQRSRVFHSFRGYYEKRGQFERALDYIQQARAEQEKYLAPLQLLLNNIGYIETYVNAGKQSFAFESLKNMEGKVIPFLQTLLPLGYLEFYLATEDADNIEKTIEGVETFIKSWGMESFRYFVFFARGRISEIRGEYEQAILGYQKSFEFAPTDLMILENLGRCYRKLKEYGKAEKSLQDALKVEPFNPKSNYEIALVYWDMGRKEKALEHLTRSLFVWENADPEYKPAAQAREKLREWESQIK